MTLAVLTGSTVLEMWLIGRLTYIERTPVRDWTPPSSWHVLNLVLAGLILVVMISALRTGRWWQRLVALVVCICPAAVIYDVCRTAPLVKQ